MVFFKKVKVVDLKHKYGGAQRGLYALEPVKAGEIIWCCECGAKDTSFTRKQLLEIIKKQPHLDYFVRSFSYMIDDDLYAIPRTYMQEKNNDECALFNHSCNPNVGFDDEDEYSDTCTIIALRDIEPGEELAYHYGFLETEASLIYGLQCKCHSAQCCGKLTFDYYRDAEFVAKYYHFMTPYLKKKADEMREKWHSTSTYVRRLPNEYNDNIEEWDKALYTLGHIKQGELVASFASDEIGEGKHYLRNSMQPNCQLIGRDVYANCDIPSETELTLYYHGILL